MSMHKIRLGCALALLAIGLAGNALAQTAPAPAPAPAPTTAPAPAAPLTPDGQVCTTFQERAQELNNNSAPTDDGLLTEIYNFVKKTVNDATKKIFTAFTSSSVYKEAVFGAMSLMIIFFGVGFTIGVVQLTYQQALIRLMKLAIISALISPDGWDYFNTTVVTFFSDGTDDLVRGVMQIATGNTSAPANASPFFELDQLAKFILQPDTIIALMGSTLAGGPFGLGMGVLMGMAIYCFVSLLITALRTYAISFVARALILGVAPIFIIFLLFDKTKNLFSAWVNALINLSLQPILLFTFLSFFVVMMTSASKDMLSADLCWTEFKQGEGTTNKLAFWRYKNPDGSPIVGDMTWKGSLDCIIKGKGDCPEFPVNVVDILSFLVLMYIAQRFSGVTDKIANDLSNAFVALDAGGKLEQFISERNSKQGGGSDTTARAPASRQTTTGRGGGGGGAGGDSASPKPGTTRGNPGPTQTPPGGGKPKP